MADPNKSFLTEPDKPQTFGIEPGGRATLVQPDARPDAIPEAKPGWFTNAPDDSWLSSAAKGTGTVLGKAASGIVGLPGDIAGRSEEHTSELQSH